MFLRLRSEEIVSNGRMVLTFIGRNTLNDPLYRDCCHFWTLLSNSLRDLVFEVYQINLFISFVKLFKYGTFMVFDID